MIKVLFAHPDPAFRKSIRGKLEHHGYYVECAGDATETIRLGLSFTPAVLICARDLADETSGLVAAESLHRHIDGLQIILTVPAADLAAFEKTSRHLHGALLLREPVDANALRAQLDAL